MMKADNLGVELIEPSVPGLYWQFRSLGHACFNHLAHEAGITPSFEKEMSKLGVKQNENSTRNSHGDSIIDLDQDTTLGLRIRISRSS